MDNQFINTYIDVIMNSLMEQIKINLQLQTQVKVHQAIIDTLTVQKDEIIASLQGQLTQNAAAEEWKTKYEAAEMNYAAAMNKLGHMETLMKQVADMKALILVKDQEIQKLKTPLKKTPTKATKQEETANTF